MDDRIIVHLSHNSKQLVRQSNSQLI